MTLTLNFIGDSTRNSIVVEGVADMIVIFISLKLEMMQILVICFMR
jgi:hypothetical protein